MVRTVGSGARPHWATDHSDEDEVSDEEEEEQALGSRPLALDSGLPGSLAPGSWRLAPGSWLLAAWGLGLQRLGPIDLL